MLGVEGLLAYLDDLLLHTQDVESHVKLLRLVLEAHRAAGIKLNMFVPICSGVLRV